jgi:hypothetical protein
MSVAELGTNCTKTKREGRPRHQHPRLRRVPNGVEMRDKAVDLISAFPPDRLCSRCQVLGELFNVLVKKARRPAAAARGHVDVARRLPSPSRR